MRENLLRAGIVFVAVVLLLFQAMLLSIPASAGTTIDVTVQLTDSQGNGLSGGVVQYYSGGWQSFGTTNGTGEATKGLSSGTYSFRMSYAGASQEKSQNIATNSTVAFRTVLATMKLLDSNNNDLAAGAQYYAGGWKTFGGGTTTATMELLPVNYSFRVSYAGASQEKSQNTATNATVVFQTTSVTMRLLDSGVTAELSAGAQYYASGWKTFGTGNTTTAMELLPVNYSFRVSYAGASQEKSQNIATNSTVVFQTALVTMKLLDSSSNELAGGAQYYAGGWKTFGGGTTTTTMELLPVSYSFRVSHGGGSWEKSQNIATNSTVIFQIRAWYRDSDGDGYGNPIVSTQACTAPAGYVADNTDCNDSDNTIYPGATELCDGKDNDCDGSIDEGAMPTWYQDSDGDTCGNPAVTTQNCTQPSGYVSDNTDCNDSDSTIYPGAPELSDGKDNDCDGERDEGTWTRLVSPIMQHILMVESTKGGTVTAPTGGTFSYANSYLWSYDPGAVVNLVAIPDAGYGFVGWTGAPDIIADVNAASTSITMNKDCVIRANFARIPEMPVIVQYSLTISSTSGGSVTVPGDGTFPYDAGTVLDLVAKADSGYKFVNWTGDVTAIANVNGASTTITMNDDYSVVANFGEIPPEQVTLTVSSSSGGSVTTPGEATFAYDEGTVVNLKAEPEEGYRFVIWIGDVDDVADVTAASTAIAMNDDYSIIATFKFGTGCFIATAAYGTPMAGEIQILRDFRDECLITNPVGEALVEFYYEFSPPIADFITEHPSLKPIVRAGLTPAVAVSAVAVNTSPLEKAAISGLLVLVSAALAMWLTRRRHKGPQYA